MSHAFRPLRSRTACASRLLLWTTLLVAALGYGASVAWAGVEPAARDAAPAAESSLPPFRNAAPDRAAPRDGSARLDRHLTPRPRAPLPPALNPRPTAPEVLCACVRHDAQS